MSYRSSLGSVLVLLIAPAMLVHLAGCELAAEESAPPPEAELSLASHSLGRCSWVPLYRYWHSAGTDHFYTANFAELGEGAHGWVLEGVVGMVAERRCRRAQRPFYRYWNPSITDHFYTTEWEELGWGGNGWIYEGIAGYLYDGRARPGFTALYRYWNEVGGDHFYTTDYSELGAGAHGWVFEKVSGAVKRADLFILDFDGTEFPTAPDEF